DLVLARDVASGAQSLKRVMEILVDDEKPLWELEIVDASGAAETHRVTDNHPDWVEGRGGVVVADLRPGFELATEGGPTVHILRVHNTGHVERTYNLEVEDFHTFFVGQRHVLVHNACPTSRASGPYSRPSNATTPAQRQSVQGKPCAKCGATANRMV